MTQYILVDQARNFGESFDNASKQYKIFADRTGIYANSSLGMGKIFHQPPHQICREVLITDPKAEKYIALKFSVEDMNDTLISDEIV